MRLFQNSGIYPAYLTRLNRLASGAATFAQRRQAFLADRFGASHFLKPVLDGDPTAFFTNGDDATLQLLWAREHSLPEKASLEDILLAQIEEHRTEVFYNIDPTRYSSAFMNRLPGSVRRKIAWRAAPSPGANFSAYDLVVCNFPGILESYRLAGWKSAWFAPAHDPLMDPFAANRNRPIDVLFVGGYTRHHRKRSELLEAVSALGGEHVVALHLDRSRLTRLAEALPSWVPGLSKHRRPDAIQSVSRQPVFGLDLYLLLSQAKIVLNGAIDMAGADRGNMRCFESMGCGCALLSDAGNYPDGMTPGATLTTYSSTTDAVVQINAMLGNAQATEALAAAGCTMISQRYSKQRQWDRFVELAQ
jgi:hypothetical protein